MDRIFGIARFIVVGVVIGVVGGVVGRGVGIGGVNDAQAAAKRKKPAGASPASHTLNACGCYKDATGACFCGRKAKCSCPGDCEPKGCDEKRAKEIQKEIAAETRKAAEADKKARKDETTRANSPEPKSETKSEKPKPGSAAGSAER